MLEIACELYDRACGLEDGACRVEEREPVVGGWNLWVLWEGLVDWRSEPLDRSREHVGWRMELMLGGQSL
jgi:hypothetical protein